MSNVQKIKEFWNERAIQYGANQEATLGEIAVKCLEIYDITRHLDHDKIILDVGCGNGYTAKIFAKNYKSKIFGIDYSPEMIEIITLNQKSQSYNIDYLFFFIIEYNMVTSFFIN